jgi:hypothetical protein
MKLVTSPFGGGLSSNFNASILNQFYTANWYVDIYFRSSSPLPIQKKFHIPRGMNHIPGLVLFLSFLPNVV